jgi:predicted aconitase with swiveling domain
MSREHAGRLILTSPLSFWGGLDPATGTIVDVHHPQHGESIKGRTVVLERTRGSTSSTSTLVDTIRRGNGPAAMVLTRPDLTVITAVQLAHDLYGADVPLCIDPSAIPRSG